jgi:predicted Ser/Thr protein kinase/intein/homing endonuclease
MPENEPKKPDITQLLEAHRRERESLHWEGTFREYFEMAGKQPKLTQLAHARICDMILAAGTTVINEGTRDETTRYHFFSEDLYGIDEALEQLVEYFKSAAQRLEVRKRILLLMGPVGGGKSTIVTLLKRGLEKWTRTEQGAVYSIKGDPMHGDPMHLIPPELRPEIQKHYGIYIEGELSPQARFDLEHTFKGKHEDVLIERIVFSEKDRVGIGTFAPSDPKSQDVSELTGSIDLSTIGEVGVESDPRAYRFDGELNVANRGMMEFIEILKCLSSNTLARTSKGLLEISELVKNKNHSAEPLQNFPICITLRTRDGLEGATKLIYVGKGKTIRIKTRKGFVLEGSPDHRIWVIGIDGEHQWRALKDLEKTDRLCIHRKVGTWAEEPPKIAHHPQKPSRKPVFIPERMTAELAKLLGYFVAEGNYESPQNGGSSPGICISATNQQVIQDLYAVTKSLGLSPRADGRGHYIIHSTTLAELFQSFGLTGRRAHEKHVPRIIRECPKELMSQFLRAYFDGDGTATKSYISCVTASEKLSEQLQQILLNYGIVAKRSTVHNKQLGRDYFTLIIDSDNIAIFNREIGFGIDYKREAAERLEAEQHIAHRDGLPNLQAHWNALRERLTDAALMASSGRSYRERIGVRQLIGDYAFEQLWRFAEGRAVPSVPAAQTVIDASETHALVPFTIRETVDNRYFYDEVEETTEGFDDLWDFHVPVGHTYIGNGFVNHNCDEKFLYSLLTLSQEQAIKTGRYAMIYADEVIMSHTNENEYQSFVGNKKNEALQDRIIMIKVPYNLRISEEERIYQKLLSQSSLQGVHIAPYTLRVAAMFAVLTRLEAPKRANVDLVKKMKLYDGEDVDGFKSKDVKELKAETVREGMFGISPRYVINRLSNALVQESKKFITPIDALRTIRDGFDQHTGITTEERERYTNLITLVRKEYDEIAKTEVQRAFVYSFEEMAKNICDNYLDNVEAYCNKEKIKDPITEEEIEPDERLMRSIEEQIGISENAKNTFRQEILIRISTYARKGKRFEYNSHERLKEAIEKKIFADLKDVVKITTSTKSPDADQLRRINEVIDRLVKNHGYTSESANELLNYVGSLLSR